MEAPVATSRSGAVDQLAPVRVSYVLSTRNRKSELEKTLQNIRQFLCPEDELIIADGGSTDGTQELAGNNRDIVACFMSAPDRGEAHALNRAILASRGRYIKLLSDDDRIDPGAMRHCIDYLEAHTEVDAIVAGGTTYRISEDGSKKFWWQHCLPEGVNLRDRIGSSLAVLTCGLGFILRRDAVAVAGLFDTRKKYVDVAYLVALLSSPLNVQYLNCKLFEHNWRPASGSFNLESDERFRNEKIQGLIGLGDWKSVASAPIDNVMTALGMKPRPGVEAALRLLLMQYRLPKTPLSKLVELAVQIVDRCLAACFCVRRAAIRARGAFARQSNIQPSLDQRQVTASQNERHIWDSRPW